MKLAAKLGVKSIDIGEGRVSIEFGGYAPPAQEYALRGSKTVKLTPEQENELERLKEEMNLEQLKALDPLRYEEMLAEGKLEDVQDEQDTGGAE